MSSIAINPKTLTELAMQKELLLDGSAARNIFHQFQFASMNVIENDLVPPGQIMLIKDEIENRFRKMYEQTFEAIDVSCVGDARTSAVMMKDKQNAFDEKTLLEAVGRLQAADKWLDDANKIPENACDACKGRGVYNNEECWHCCGEGTDPTK